MIDVIPFTANVRMCLASRLRQTGNFPWQGNAKRWKVLLHLFQMTISSIFSDKVVAAFKQLSNGLKTFKSVMKMCSKGLSPKWGKILLKLCSIACGNFKSKWSILPNDIQLLILQAESKEARTSDQHHSKKRQEQGHIVERVQSSCSVYKSNAGYFLGDPIGVAR